MPWRDPGEVPLHLANRMLQQQDWARARLAPFSSRTLALAVGPLHLLWTIGDGGTLATGLAGTVPDLELAVSPLAVPGLLADPSRWNELVRETGDAQLGGALKDIAQTTPWFVEKLLGDALGPIAGQRVADLGRSLLQFPAYAAERLTDSAVSYARDEAELLAPAAAMRRFTTDVAAVEGAVDTLAARIAALQERLPQPR
jgi:ubiquinone biosynthesis protein UbiJ